MCCGYGEGSYPSLSDGSRIAAGSTSERALPRVLRPSRRMCSGGHCGRQLPGEQSWSLSADGTKSWVRASIILTHTVLADAWEVAPTRRLATTDSDAVLDYDDGSCTYIGADECDCGSSVEDASVSAADHALLTRDADGICDDVDDCIGAFDQCGVQRRRHFLRRMRRRATTTLKRQSTA